MSAATGCIGILGGSFDPVHLAHLQLALAAKQALGLDEVRFIPAGQPAQKANLAATAEQRTQMLRLALAPHPGLTLDLREVTSGRTAYTIETLESLRVSSRASIHDDASKAALVLLLGADQFLNLPTWKRWQGLFDLSHVAVAGRPGYELQEPHWPRELLEFAQGRRTESAADLHDGVGKLFVINMPPLPISATQIRALCKAGDKRAALLELLPAAVLDYIENQQLYSH